MIEEHWLVPYLEAAAPVGARLAIDVGANKGEWTDLLSPRCEHVVSVEPDCRAFGDVARLSRACDLPLRAAAASHEGVSNLFMRQDAAQTSLLEFHPIGAGGQSDAPAVRSVKVECVTLDAISLRAKALWGVDSVDFIKVDVEGAEADVLAGATLPAFANTRWLIEVHDRREAVAAELARLGFSSVTMISHPSPSAHPHHFWVYADKRTSQ